MNLSDFRQKFPQYNDMSDQELADSLYTKHYSDMPRDQFNDQIGFAPIGAEPVGMVPRGPVRQFTDTRAVQQEQDARNRIAAGADPATAATQAAAAFPTLQQQQQQTPVDATQKAMDDATGVSVSSVRDIRPGEQADPWLTSVKKVLQNTGSEFKQTFGNLLSASAQAMKAPNVSDLLARSMDPEFEQKKQADLAQAQEHGRQISLAAGRELSKNQAVVDPDTLAGFSAHLLNGGIQLAPALTAGIATTAVGAPGAGTLATLGLMGTQTFGDQYGASIAKGRTPDQAVGDATFSSAVTTALGVIPVGTVLRGGAPFIQRVTGGAITGAAANVLADATEQGYNAGLYDEKTPIGDAAADIKAHGLWDSTVQAYNSADSPLRQALHHERMTALMGGALGASGAVVAHPLSREPAGGVTPPDFTKMRPETASAEVGGPGAEPPPAKSQAPGRLPAPQEPVVEPEPQAAPQPAEAAPAPGEAPQAPVSEKPTSFAREGGAPQMLEGGEIPARKPGEAPPLTSREELDLLESVQSRQAAPEDAHALIEKGYAKASGDDSVTLLPAGRRRMSALRDEVEATKPQQQPQSALGKGLEWPSAKPPEGETPEQQHTRLFDQFQSDVKGAIEDLQSADVKPAERMAIRRSLTQLRPLAERAAYLRDRTDIADAPKVVRGLYANMADITGTEFAPLELTKDEPASRIKPAAQESAATRSRLDDLLSSAATRHAMEEQGQNILDDMDEKKISPQDVSNKFWTDTYWKMNAEGQQRFNKYAKSIGFQPGDVLSVDKDGKQEIAQDWQHVGKFIGSDLPQRAEHLEGIERGYVSMMKWANDKADEAAAPTTEQAKIAGQPVEVASQPTEAQKAAGNYKKGHINFQGLPITVENLKGSIRSGKSANGKEWQRVMNAHYGYVKATEGADGDHLDVFLGSRPTSRKAFVVDQLTPDGKTFDEHKAILGVGTQEEAEALYRSHYPENWKGMGAITPMSVDEFKQWAKTEDTKKPVAWSPPVKRNMRVVQPQHDSILEALSKIKLNGALTRGLSLDEMEKEGLDRADMQKAPGHGINRPFTRGGGSLDAAAERLSELGYPVHNSEGKYDKNVLLDRIHEELAGKRHLSTAADAHESARQAALERYEREFEEHFKQQPQESIDDAYDRAKSEFQSLLDERDQIESAAAERERQPGEDDETPLFHKKPGSQQDLFAKDDRDAKIIAARNALKKLEAERDRKRNSGQESLETGRPDDLFSQSRNQQDFVKEGKTKLYVAPGQMQLPFAKRAQAKLELASVPARVHLEPIGEFKYGGNREGVDAAADVTSDLKKEPQEIFAMVALNAQHKPIAVLQHTIGTSGASLVDRGPLLGAVLSIPDAKSVYMVHNHPSGVTNHSAPDEMVINALKHYLDRSKIKFAGSIIHGADEGEYMFMPPGETEVPSGMRPIAPGKETSVPVVRRRYKETGRNVGMPMRDEKGVQAAIDRYGDGIYFSDNRMNLLAHMPMTAEEMEKIQASGSVDKVLRTIHEQNAVHAVVALGKAPEDSKDHEQFLEYQGRKESARNMARFLKGAGVQVTDVVVDRVSEAYAGGNIYGTEPANIFFHSNLALKDVPPTGKIAPVRATVEHVLAPFRNKPGVEVVQRFDDLPAEVRNRALQHGADSSVDAFFDPPTGKVYAIADAVHDLDQFEGVMLHEVVAHYGLRQMLSPEERNTIMDGVARDLRDQVENKAQAYGLDMDNEAERRIAAEEVIAEAAESYVRGETIGDKVREWLDRAIQAVKDGLTRLGLMKPAYGDGFIASLLSRLREHLRSGDAQRMDRGERPQGVSGIKEGPLFHKKTIGEQMELEEKRTGFYEQLRKVVKVVPESDFVMGFRKILNPVGVSDLSREAATMMRAGLGELAHETRIVQEALEQYSRAIDKLSIPDRLDMMDAIEKGEKQPIKELQPIADEMRKTLDAWRDTIRSLGEGYLDNYIENYFPHFWNNQRTARTVASIFGRRSMKGPASFLKQRKIPTIKEGMELGLSPLTTNPLMMTLLKVREMQRFYVGTLQMRKFKETGLAKFLPAMKPMPEGWTEIKDAVGRVRQWSEKENGWIDRGKYIMPEDAARIVNNHLSASALANFPAAQWIRIGSNALNAMQLGFSGFHLGFTTLDAIISKNALGVERLLHGEFAGAAKAFLEGATGPGAAIANIRRGMKLLKAYSHPEKATPAMQKIVQAMTAAGGRASMDQYFLAARGVSPFKGVGIRSLVDDVRKSLSGKGDPLHKAVGQWGIDYGQRVWNDLRELGTIYPKWEMPFEIAGRVTRASTAVIMEHIVPLQKLGVFYDMAQDALRRDPTMSPERMQKIMQRAWNSVDNRLGEMVYNNLFWNRTFKDAMHLAVRAVGWNYGTISEIGGAPIDVLKVIDKAVRDGKVSADDVGHKIPYVIAMTLTTALFGSILTYLFTGHGPQKLKDYFFPPTGGTTRYGTPQRVSMPSYAKDVYEYSQQPGETVLNKLNPIYSEIHEIWANEDFFGGAIYNPDESLLHKGADIGSFIGKESMPFSFQSRQQLAGSEKPGVGGSIRKALPFIGITAAPGYVTSPEQLEERHHLDEQQKYMKTLNYRIRQAQEAGDKEALQKLLKEKREMKPSMHREQHQIKRENKGAKQRAMQELRDKKQQESTSSNQDRGAELMQRISPHLEGKTRSQAVASLRQAGMPAMADLIAALPKAPPPGVQQAMSGA